MVGSIQGLVGTADGVADLRGSRGRDRAGPRRVKMRMLELPTPSSGAAGFCGATSAAVSGAALEPTARASSCPRLRRCFRPTLKGSACRFFCRSGGTHCVNSHTDDPFPALASGGTVIATAAKLQVFGTRTIDAAVSRIGNASRSNPRTAGLPAAFPSQGWSVDTGAATKPRFCRLAPAPTLSGMGSRASPPGPATRALRRLAETDRASA